MKILGPLIALVFLVGCSSTPWKDTGSPGPWCAPDTRAHVFHRTVDAIGWSAPHGEMAFAGKSGFKKNGESLREDLDKYFCKCTFINEWPIVGESDSFQCHKSPFDLCLVSINPIVVVGVEKQDPNASALSPLIRSGCATVMPESLVGEIPISISIPYYPNAKIVWFSPAVDRELHSLDVASGTNSFKIRRNEQMIVTVEGGQLTTSRK